MARMNPRMKIVVIGGGMAGMSCAAELSQHCDVTVLEAEDAPGYHSSGRSAAAYIEPYVNGTIFTLTSSSRAFFENPPAGFADAPLVTPRADVMIASEREVASRGCVPATLAGVLSRSRRGERRERAQAGAHPATGDGRASGIGSERDGHRRARFVERLPPHVEGARRFAGHSQPGRVVGASRTEAGRLARVAGNTCATRS